MFSYHPTLTHLTRRQRRIAIVLLLAAFGLLLAAAAAQAATATCPASALSQPFARWGDTNSYTLVPEGDFEGALAHWTLSGGAHQTTGSEPFAATGVLGAHSLALPTGASAQSPFMCVDVSEPSYRLFARSTGLLTTVAASVVYKTALGSVALPLGVVAPGGQWQPTAALLTGSLAGELLAGGTAQAALRFTALTGSADIDDVFLDPRMR